MLCPTSTSASVEWMVAWWAASTAGQTAREVMAVVAWAAAATASVVGWRAGAGWLSCRVCPWAGVHASRLFGSLVRAGLA